MSTPNLSQDKMETKTIQNFTVLIYSKYTFHAHGERKKKYTSEFTGDDKLVGFYSWLHQPKE